MKNQNERVADAIYKARCLKTLQELGLPTEGWICEWIEDTDEPEEVCELCGCSRVRFLHHMRHPAVADSIAVGCLCDGIMSGDELSAVAREREARNRAKRRQNFIHGEWKPEFAGPHATRWKKKLRNGPVCLIQQDSSGHYAVWHNNRWCYRCRGKPITTFAQAASALFTVNDPKRNTL
ncbi:MAG: hypothetical protein IKK75_02470 [Clostridia bacterium]|nr:hypothetical protein [Clostridia bacterium]